MQYQKEEVRNRIIEAAFEEFRKGYSRTNMLAISNRAKVPIGNLYRYFPSKEELFSTLVTGARAEIIKIITEGFARYGEILNKDPSAIGDILTALAVEVASASELYEREFSLLTDKSGGSKFEKFSDEINSVVKNSIFESIFGGENEILCDMVVAGIVLGTYGIISRCPKETRREELRKLYMFYFFNFEERGKAF